VDPVPDPLLLRKSGSAGDRTRDLCICSQKLWPLDHRGGHSSIICRENWNFIKTQQEKRVLYMKIGVRVYLAEFFWEWELLQWKVVQRIKTHILCPITFFLKSLRQWDNVEKCGRAGQATDGNKIRRTLFACWIPKATNTHSEYVIVFTFPLQRWLNERASILHYTYIHCLSC